MQMAICLPTTEQSAGKPSERAYVIGLPYNVDSRRIRNASECEPVKVQPNLLSDQGNTHNAALPNNYLKVYIHSTAPLILGD